MKSRSRGCILGGAGLCPGRCTCTGLLWFPGLKSGLWPPGFGLFTSPCEGLFGAGLLPEGLETVGFLSLSAGLMSGFLVVSGRVACGLFCEET